VAGPLSGSGEAPAAGHSAARSNSPLVVPPLIECVANFSEGRDRATVRAIEDAIASAGGGVRILRSEMDADHNRSVITFAAPPEAVSEAALLGIAVAVERIDLRRHSGVHPRMGAADVIPFVPLEGAALADCVAIARRTGEQIWKRFHVPVYFYEAAALSPDRQRLENGRRGGFEHPNIAPDLGGPELHPSAGACIVGARKILIAFNVNLATDDVGVAREIARKIRASSGGMPFVKALGLPLAGRGLVQVSLNLTDFEQTPLHAVFDAVKREASARGVAIAGSEIIGLLPKKSLEDAAAHYLQCEKFESGLVLENRLADAGEMGQKAVRALE
jgi:glutamate formiminotransferase